MFAIPGIRDAFGTSYSFDGMKNANAVLIAARSAEHLFYVTMLTTARFVEVDEAIEHMRAQLRGQP